MSTANLGNALYQLIADARNALFNQGELAQLTYGALDVAAGNLRASTEDEVAVTYPIGYRADRTTITSTNKYKKEQLLARYGYLAFNQLALNGLVQLVTIVEALLGDVVRAVVTRYPQKLGAKRTIPMTTVLESTSIEEIHVRATDALLNELAYKSPTDFAESTQPILSINLLECPAFHRYVEIKASRDIFIHNRGVANEIYARKCGSHARVRPGQQLPADITYFLESYESCLQFTEWLERELHSRWHSSLLEEHERRQLELQIPPPSSFPVTNPSAPPSVSAQSGSAKKKRSARKGELRKTGPATKIGNGGA